MLPATDDCTDRYYREMVRNAITLCEGNPFVTTTQEVYLLTSRVLDMRAIVDLQFGELDPRYPCQHRNPGHRLKASANGCIHYTLHLTCDKYKGRGMRTKIELGWMKPFSLE